MRSRRVPCFFPRELRIRASEAERTRVAGRSASFKGNAIAPMPGSSSRGDIVGSTSVAGSRVREDVHDCHDRTITAES